MTKPILIKDVYCLLKLRGVDVKNVIFIEYFELVLYSYKKNGGSKYDRFGVYFNKDSCKVI